MVSTCSTSWFSSIDWSRSQSQKWWSTAWVCLKNLVPWKIPLVKNGRVFCLSPLIHAIVYHLVLQASDPFLWKSGTNIANPVLNQHLLSIFPLQWLLNWHIQMGFFQELPLRCDSMHPRGHGRESALLQLLRWCHGWDMGCFPIKRGGALRGIHMPII